MALTLTDTERQMLTGDHGAGTALAMRVIVELAEAQGARDLVAVSRAHVGATFEGPASIDLLRKLLDLGATFAVPTTLNIASYDVLHPELFLGSAQEARAARDVMDLYVELGGKQTWTCAPYLLQERPEFGERVAWTESGAVMFANSVIGARTDRGGSLIDVLAAIAGRMPNVGFYTDAGRRAQRHVRLEGFSRSQLAEEIVYHLIGFAIGRRFESDVPLIDGIPSDVSEENLQSLGAAMATSGAMGMFHVLGVTPEAPTIEAAFGGEAPSEVVKLTPTDLADAAWHLNSDLDPDTTIDAVCLGTPHYSFNQFVTLVGCLREDASGFAAGVDFYVNTNRHVREQLVDAGLDRELADAGVTIVTDTCTYLAPLLKPGVRRVMTSSAKWAQYGAAHHDVDIALGSTRECVMTARAGKVWRDVDLWT